MHREYHRWYSPSLGRDMELLVFGHAGRGSLVFPTSQGRFFEWEDRGMIGALGEHLEQRLAPALLRGQRGRRELVRAVASTRATGPGGTSSTTRYVLDEVLPFTRHRNPNPFLIATGASFGAYHAVNFALPPPGPRRAA